MKNILLLISLLSLSLTQAQCGMKEIPLNERVGISDLVIEGQVIAQESFEPDGSPMILTRNTVEITKIFKGNPTSNTIEIITKGGVLGLRADKVTTALELSINDKGVFTLQNYQNGTYQAIAGSQSFIVYSQLEYKAYSVTKQWDNIDTELFNEITIATGTPFRSVARLDFKYSPDLSKIGSVTVTGVSPLNVNAGVGDVITITGSGFGATQGANLVVFSNADTGGSLSLTPDNSQIVSWSDTEVRVQVPSGAGNGPVAIFIDANNNDISSQQLAVGYNHVNFTFVLSDGTNNFNVVSEVSLYDKNSNGGYDFDYSTGFVAEPDATATLDDIFEKWRCTTGVNFVRGTDLIAGNPANTDDPQTSGADSINVVKFDGSDLPAGSGILAFVLTRAAGCIQNNALVAYVLEMDVVINDDINWHYRDGGASSNSLDFNEFDFESVMLHEIGHAQQLGHVIDPTKVMHFSIGNGVQNRVIDEADVIGGNYINNKSAVIAPCGLQPMQYADCGFVYDNNLWSPFSPTGTVNRNSTVTVQNGATSFTETLTRDITVNNGATLNQSGNEEITVYGNITNNGTAIFNQVIFAGNTPQSVNGNQIEISELDILNTATLNFNTITNITDRFNNNGGIINTNGNLTLKSSMTSTAHVDQFSGTINGDVTVERHYPSRRAFRFISPSVTTTSTIFENWQENGAYTPGIGTHISGSVAGANGFDSTGSGNPSLFLYDNTGSNGWFAAASTNAPSDVLTAGNAYRLFVRGDRNPSLLTSVSSNETTLRTTGSLATGTINGNALSATGGAFGFIGNPYQAPVNMEAVLTRSGSNLAPTYYIWDPNLASTGAYVAVNTVTDVSSNTSSPANQFAQPNQAFFVQTASNGPASISFTEADKALDQGNLALNNVYGSMRLSAVLKNSSDNSAVDGFNIIFDTSFSNAITLNDAEKLLNLDESISVSQNGMNYSIAERNLPNDQEVIELSHINYRNTSYNYSILLSGASLNVYLYDKHENIRHQLTNNSMNNVNFTVDLNDTSSTASDRFSIEFSNQTLSSADLNPELFTVYPNPSNGSFQIDLVQPGEAQLNIYNLLGQKVYTSMIIESRVRPVVTNLRSGNYILQVTQNGSTATEKIIIK